MPYQRYLGAGLALVFGSFVAIIVEFAILEAIVPESILIAVTISTLAVGFIGGFGLLFKYSKEHSLAIANAVLSLGAGMSLRMSTELFEDGASITELPEILKKYARKGLNPIARGSLDGKPFMLRWFLGSRYRSAFMEFSIATWSNWHVIVVPKPSIRFAFSNDTSGGTFDELYVIKEDTSIPEKPFFDEGLKTLIASSPVRGRLEVNRDSLSWTVNKIVSGEKDAPLFRHSISILEKTAARIDSIK